MQLYANTQNLQQDGKNSVTFASYYYFIYFFFHSHRLSSKCFELTGEYGEDELYDGYRQNKDDFKMFLCQQLTNDCKPGNDKKKVEL